MAKINEEQVSIIKGQIDYLKYYDRKEKWFKDTKKKICEMVRAL